MAGEEKIGILDGKVAVITGVNSGVGRCTALLFASEGAKIVGIARRENELEKVKSEIIAKGGSFVAYAGDVTVKEEIEKGI